MSASKAIPTGKRLDSWKEIAAFFDRDERTVNRWEKDLGLPIRRLPGTKGRVYAFEAELAEWLAASRNGGTSPGHTPGHSSDSETDGARLPIIDGQRPESESATVELSTVRRSKVAHGKIIGLVMVAVFALGILSLALFHRHPDADSVAVLPLTNGGGNANSDYLSDGITESLIGNLAHVPQLRVKSRSSVFRYKGKDVDPQKAGNELGVSALVTGRVTSRGDSIEVNAEIINVRDNTEIWNHHYSAKDAEIVSLQKQIAGDIAVELRSSLSGLEKQQVTRQSTQNPEAYELYLKGRYAWSKRTIGELDTAISYFDQALAKDPSYALAYSGLADVYSVLPDFGGNPSEDYSKSNRAARRALDLDATLAHPHAILGSNEMRYDWDFAGGEAKFKKSFELDPNDATGASVVRRRYWHDWGQRTGSSSGSQSCP